MKSKILVVMLAVMQIFSFCAFGEGEDVGFAVYLNRVEENGKIIQYMQVNGKAVEGFENRPVTLSVVRPDSEGLSGKERYAALHQGYVESDGSFSFSFPFNEAEGVYTVYARVNGCNAEKEKIECFSTESLVAMLEAIEEKNMTTEALVTELTENGTRNGIDVSIFSGLSEGGKKTVCAAILSDEDTYKLNRFNEVLNDSIAFSGLSSDSLPSVKQSIIDRFDGEKFEIKSHFVYEKYLEENDSFREKVLTELSGKDTSDADKLKKAFENAVFKSTFRNLQNYTEIEDIINFFAEILEEEPVNDFNSLSSTDKKLVAKYIYKNKNKIETPEDFSSVLSKGIGNIDDLRKEAIKGSSSGGGGGGGGGGGAAPVKKVEVEREEVKLPEPVEIVEKVDFADLNDYDWAKKSINALKDKGIIDGRTSTEFAPGEPVKRGEFAKLLFSAFGYEGKKEEIFSDIKGHWSAEYVNGLAFLGIVQGTGEGFNPEAEITREDVCVLLYRAMSKEMVSFEGVSYKTDFKDSADISDYAVNSVGALTGIKVLSGFPDNTVGPKKKITRAEAAVLLYNVLEKL